MLNEKQMKCIELMVYTNKRKQEIAKEIGVANTSISYWLNNEEFQNELEKEMKNGFRSLAVKAKRRLGELIDSKNEGVALGACKEVLNKAGYKETDKIEANLSNDIKIEITE